MEPIFGSTTTWTWKEPVALKFFTIKKCILTTWICVEILQAVIAIVLASIAYNSTDENSTTTTQHDLDLKVSNEILLSQKI